MKFNLEWKHRAHKNSINISLHTSIFWSRYTVKTMFTLVLFGPNTLLKKYLQVSKVIVRKNKDSYAKFAKH
jgi:hypothetical protein